MINYRHNFRLYSVLEKIFLHRLMCISKHLCIAILSWNKLKLSKHNLAVMTPAKYEYDSKGSDKWCTESEVCTMVKMKSKTLILNSQLLSTLWPLEDMTNVKYIIKKKTSINDESNIRSGDSLMPSGSKLFPGPMLTKTYNAIWHQPAWMC